MKKLTGEIWDLLEELETITVPKTEVYYCNDAMSDYHPKEGKFQFWIFIRSFTLGETKTGKLKVTAGRDVVELSESSLKKLRNKIESFVDNECEGQVPDSEQQNREWMPDKWERIKKAVKFYNKNIRE